MREKLREALSEISGKHIAEAASAKKRRRKYYYLGVVAAVLALAILTGVLLQPLAISANAVSVAEYPEYEWQHRDIDSKLHLLDDFFSSSMTQCLSGTVEENMVYSPVNLYMALAITAEITSGSSQAQILELTNASELTFLRSLSSEIWNCCYRDEKSITLLANSLWLDDSMDYSQEVMDTLSESYYASVYQGDLGSSKTNNAITAWLNRQTGGLLKKETQQVSLAPETVLALYSTVFYRAKWSDSCKFSSQKNTEGVFHSPNTDVNCTYMNKEHMQTNYYWGNDYGAVSLSLKDGSQMWLILPDEGKTVDDVLSSQEYAQMLFQESDANFKYLKVNLSLPKFDLRVKSDLKQELKALGITNIFDGDNADFSNAIDSDTPVWLTNVNQATRVAIDEDGITAASYIELPAAGAAMPPEEEIDFILDRPFLFVITNTYGIPLFAGVVNKP